MPYFAFWVVWCLTACLAAVVLTGQLVLVLGRRGILDRPNERSSHARATPRGGGLAIVAVVVVAAVLAVVLHPESYRRLSAVIFPALTIAIISWFDDVSSVPNRVRFAFHLIAAAGATSVLGPVSEVSLGSFGMLALGPLAWPLTLLWIVGLTNAFNFMDGIDGIAGITSAAAGIALAALAAVVAAPAVGGVAAALACASLGFLAFNWQPARIFMGDVGSAFCGFVVAVLPLAFPPELVPAAIPVAVLAVWPFVFDTAFTIVRRLRRRENVFQAHRSHLYQRLVIAGWSHRAVAAIYGGLAAMSGAIAVAPWFDGGLRHTVDFVSIGLVVLGAVTLVGMVLVWERQAG